MCQRVKLQSRYLDEASSDDDDDNVGLHGMVKTITLLRLSVASMESSPSPSSPRSETQQTKLRNVIKGGIRIDSCQTIAQYLKPKGTMKTSPIRMAVAVLCLRFLIFLFVERSSR